MKKIICLGLVFTMLFSGCSRWKIEIVDPTKEPIEIEQESEISETEKEPEISETEQEEPVTFPKHEYFGDFNIISIEKENGERYFIKLSENESGEFFAMEEFSYLSVPSDRSITKENEVIATFYDENRNNFNIIVYEDDLFLSVHKDGIDENFSIFKSAEEKIRAFTEEVAEKYIDSGKVSPNNAEDIFPVPGMEVFDVIKLFNKVYSPFIELNYEEQTELQKILDTEKWTATGDIPDEISYLDILPENTFTSNALNQNNVLNFFRYNGKCYICLEWYGVWSGKKYWVAEEKVADEIESFRLSVYENFKIDGRWPYLDEEEEPYLNNPGEFDREEFLKELEIFIACTSGSHGVGTEYTANQTGLYAIMKAYYDGIAAGENFDYDDDGFVLVKAKAVDEAAKYGFGIREYSRYIPPDNGKYTVPPDTPYKNPKVESIVTNGEYIYCTVNFYDLGDTEYEYQLEQKEYTFRMFEAEGKTRYRLISMYYNYSGGYDY